MERRNHGLRVTTIHYAPDCVTEIGRSKQVFNGSGAGQVAIVAWLAAALLLIGVALP